MRTKLYDSKTGEPLPDKAVDTLIRYVSEQSGSTIGEATRFVKMSAALHTAMQHVKSPEKRRRWWNSPGA